jgi:uncharacterized protein (DUF885 family)
MQGIYYLGYMKYVFILFAGLLAFTANAQNNIEPRKVIDKVIGDVDRFNKEQFPDTITAKFPLGSFKEEDLARRYQFYKTQVAILNTIDQPNLQMNDRIDLELMKYRLQDQLNYFEFKEYMNPILSDEGFHTQLAHEARVQPGNALEFRLYIRKLKDFPRYAAEQMEWIRKGLAMGISQPVVALKGYEATYNTHITDTVEKSLFFQPFKNKPSQIRQEPWDSILTEAKEAITKDVIPTYRSIKKFFETEYYPKARKTIGVSAIPNGKAYYEALVKYHTTTNMTPDEVFDIGMSEVARIKKEMEALIKQVGFKGSFKEFFTFLRTDKRFYATTPEQLLKEASYIAKKIDGRLPSLFGKLPRQPYGVSPVPDYLAPSYTTGRYAGASINSRNAGQYWVNTYNLPSRTLYTLEALTLHEAVPGHHLQTALTQELNNLPVFRRNLYVNAFGEGWGLYSEYLGTELGLYKDPYSKFGRYTYEMWRACRLVIDAGIHSKGWTREQAVEFLSSNSALSLHEVNTEVNRYITWPGQALSYKIGELKIIELRRKAEKELGEKFDVRKFHDLVLSQGSVTLSILELVVNDWIEKEKK